MERWAKYKGILINVGQTKVIRAYKADKGSMAYSEAKVSKGKMWVLTADHFDLDAFASKDEAMRVAERIVKGDFDCK